jgi:peptide/nickel transport system ATP-binding protein
MLSVQDISVAYPGTKYEKAQRPVIEHFNLELKPGEICSIVGESGCGKTTVVRSILGCLPGGGRVTSGNILFEGESLLGYSKEQWQELRGTKISMIFQDSGAMINPIRRIGSQFVEYIRTHRSMTKEEARKTALDMLEKMRLPDPENIMRSYPFQLSGGMRQRVGIAMAMTFQPLLLLADEPTSALDVTTQAQIVRQMMELREQFGTAIIIVTHNLGIAAYMADKILVMREGVIVEQGTREQILHAPQAEYTKALLDAVPSLGGERYV